MALWDLKVELDCPEPRPLKGRLVVSADGTTWDMANSSNVWADPVTGTAMLMPNPVNAAWTTTYTGDYARYSISDYSFITPLNWEQMQIKAPGDYYLQSLGLTETVMTTLPVVANQAMYLSLYVPGLKDVNEDIILKCAWRVSDANQVEVWLTGNGTCVIRKNGVQVGKYEAGNKNIAPGGFTWKPSSTKNTWITLMLIPCRQRELLVISDFGVNFNHVFTDLPIGVSNVITPATNFYWTVPGRQATVQLAKIKYATSGYVLSPTKEFRYPPPVGATFGVTSAYDIIGTGVATMTSAIVLPNGSPYTPNGVIDQVRMKINFAGTGTGTWGLYEVDMVYQPVAGSTSNSPVDITSAVTSLNLQVDENGRASCSFSAYRKRLQDLGVQQPQITSDRPMRIAINTASSGAPVWKDIFRGTAGSPGITYWGGPDADKDFALLEYTGTDRSGDFDLIWIVESFPYDGLTPDYAIDDLITIAGYDPADVETDTFTLLLPYTKNISRGEYSLAPDYGDTVGSYLDKIKNDYYPNWLTGWFPTLTGYKYVWRNPASTTTSVMTLWQTTAGAITGGIPQALAPSRVIRAMRAHWETSEATQVQVIGLDPTAGVYLYQQYVDDAAELPSTPPASRPANWRGRPVPYQFRDPALTTQEAVDRAALVLYDRIVPGRAMIEFEADFLVLVSSNRPIWLNDIVQIMEPDGTTVKGLYRILSIPEIRFEFESSTVKIRRGKYTAQLLPS